MGNLFTLDDDTKSTIRAALDDIITEFGKTCRLVYPARMTNCTNCVYDPIGQRSSSVWRTGGPIPFSNGMSCPLCQGAGKKAVESSEDVQMKVEWEPKNFFYPIKGLDVRVPYSICQTKSYIWEMPKIKQADHIIIDVPIEPYIRAKFKMTGEPAVPGNIIQARYVITVWERVG